MKYAIVSVLLLLVAACNGRRDRDRAARDDTTDVAGMGPLHHDSTDGMLATRAETVYVTLANKQRRAILLSGLDYPFGYVLVDPGGPERILTGVYSDDDLLDELRAYFDLPGDSDSTPPRATT